MAEGKIVVKLNGIRASLPIALVPLMGLDHLYYIFRVEFQLRPEKFIFGGIFLILLSPERGLQSKNF